MSILDPCGCAPCNHTCGSSWRTKKVLLVGEDNPWGNDPRMALFHLPRQASGNRLREHLGLTDLQYQRLFKMNLCPEKWSMKIAREVANIVKNDPNIEVAVMLGAKVKKAFNMQDINFFSAGHGHKDGPLLISLPHPSGRNLLWNHPTARTRAQLLLRRSCQAIYLP